MFRLRLTKLFVLLVVLINFHSRAVRAEDPDQGAASDRTDEKLILEVSRLAKNVQQRCEFLSDRGSGKKLLPHSDPILRWSNPTAGKVFGDVCVWTENGRPQLVACIYRFFSPNWGATLEVCSLSSEKLTGQIGGRRFWSPDTAGVKRQALPVADPPANSAPARLVQMRRLAGEFAAHLEDTRGTNTGVTRQLRLLTKPIYRYSPPNAVDSPSDYVDGALFAFVEATDPEVILVLEARQTERGMHWEYGLARMNRDALRVTFRNDRVWSVPYLENQLNQETEPYSLFSLEQPPLSLAK